jgi:hypothetical protein
MRKSSRFIALAVVLGLTSWLSVRPNAEAYPYSLCTTVNGTSCYHNGVGATAPCWLRFPGSVGTCTCEQGYIWEPNPAWHCPPEMV